MKSKIVLLIGVIFLTSCTSKKHNFESIEFMSYTYRWTGGPAKLELRCHRYSLVDKYGKSLNYWKKSYPTQEILFFKSFVGEQLIDSILTAARKQNENKKDSIKKERIVIYDGPCLKVKINYSNGNSKTINFMLDDEDKTKQPFLELNKYLGSTNEGKKTEIFNDTIAFSQKKMELIHLTMKDDTSISKFRIPPPPAPPEEQIKYEIPKTN